MFGPSSSVFLPSAAVVVSVKSDSMATLLLIVKKLLFFKCMDSIYSRVDQKWLNLNFSFSNFHEGVLIVFCNNTLYNIN